MRVIFSLKRFFACVLFVLCAFLPACGEFTSSWYSDFPIKVSEDNSENIVTLSWLRPTINADGSRLDDLRGFKIYYGTSSRNYIKIIDVGNENSVIVGGLSTGNWYFAVTAYDHTGNESGYSNEVIRVFN